MSERGESENDTIAILTLKTPVQGEEPEKKWERGRCKTREEKYTDAKEVKSVKLWVVVSCANVSEKSSKKRTRIGPFGLAKGRPLCPWKSHLIGLLQVGFRLHCEQK